MKIRILQKILKSGKHEFHVQSWLWFRPFWYTMDAGMGTCGVEMMASFPNVIDAMKWRDEKIKFLQTKQKKKVISVVRLWDKKYD